ncbi:MAG: hypothetical protein ACXQTW_08395 [Candidatus Methanospirareceae archaeon]
MPKAIWAKRSEAFYPLLGDLSDSDGKATKLPQSRAVTSFLILYALICTLA